MTANDEDIAADVLARSQANPDALYVLAGSDMRAYLPPVTGYWRDEELPYEGHARDGWRQFLYEQAVSEHGYDNWFLLLHTDEVWAFDPRALPLRWPTADGFQFREPFYFPRQGEEWDETLPALDQLRWSLGPGWPEFRMFHGSPKIFYDPSQHYDVTPQGLKHVVQTELEIKHYPFRSPASHHLKVATHRTASDLGNYQHVLDGPISWSDERIREWQEAVWQQKDCWRELRCD